MDRPIDKIWRENTRHLFEGRLACACSGQCRSLGYCPLNGCLRVYTEDELNTVIKKISEDPEEVAAALKWWRKMKAKREKTKRPPGAAEDR